MALQNSSQAAPAYFQALLDRGQKRAPSDEPQLQLGLQDIARKVRNLGKGFTDARAHYLLSASGVNTSDALRDLEELSGAKAGPAPSSEPMITSGVKEDLAQRYQSDFQKMVDSHIKRAHDDFDKMIEERLHGVDWDAHRQRIYEHFGLKKPQNMEEQGGAESAYGQSGFGRSSRRPRPNSTASKSFGMSGMSRSVIGSVGQRGVRSSVFGDVAEKVPADGIRPAPEDNLLRKKQKEYAGKVTDLNAARREFKNYPILKHFAEVEQWPSNEDTSMLVQAFKALVEITKESDTAETLTDKGAIRERTYAKAYLDDSRDSEDVVQIRKQILNGSRTYLESLFKEQLIATVKKSPREANTGGTPDPLSHVKGYVRVRAARKELGPDAELLQEINGDYCWAVIFYLLRSGQYEQAMNYVNANIAAFRQIDRQFTKYLKAYVDSSERRLPTDIQTQINNEYSQRQRLAPEDSIDPYRMMCYKVIGRCDIGRRSLDNITNDMMDWLWLQFALAREYNRFDEYAHEAFSLEDVRASIKEIGERYFGAGSEIANAPTTLFFMQVLAGLFEKAVADLYPHNYLSAVHFAIGLDFYGLLRVSNINNSDDLLTYTTRQQPQIAFGSMIGLYTRDFRTSEATWAVDYLSLICLNADLDGDIGKAQKELCYQALTELVLETREFAQLLGDIKADGSRIPGAIENRLSLIKLQGNEFLKHITLVAARTAQEQGRTTDAALLYHLSEDYSKVLAVVNEALSLALTTDLGDTPARLLPLKPRNITDQNNQDASLQQASLSLTSIDDPVQLAQDIKTLYQNDGTWTKAKIEEKQMHSCEILLLLAAARRELEAGRWAPTLDYIHKTDLLPTDPEARGNISFIRSKAQNFEILPQSVARVMGHLMVWTVIACSNQVERLSTQGFENAGTKQLIKNTVYIAKDVMVFAGLIKYKLPGRVWETIARVGQDLEAFRVQ
ncbi:uncharacterized protein MYCFIDRAFT_35446 [Pseudocercospora fijiensis CIRAD86]|uniref:Nuclear pore protein n=1 Tax=Pseudocercospora fijiensis (strain CIRAD86) TaxID=383855 RepID=N1QA97_PSEFD|nr:uncharacterized protein MYCFIDRAFT_35446 [Pseudocercospora fijiensis CIRAD86]EME88711.1 hypothetical protein MYCFIDRAFT_35446 [Pseudocercospora fijiensis CIRAD86]